MRYIPSGKFETVKEKETEEICPKCKDAKLYRNVYTYPNDRDILVFDCENSFCDYKEVYDSKEAL